MKKISRNISTVIALLGIAVLPFAAGKSYGGSDAGLVFSAGKKDSAYWNLASRFKKIAAEQGIKVEVLESIGSVQNLDRLEDAGSPVNLALAQSDAVHDRSLKKPEMADQFAVMESIGLECVFLIGRAGGGIETDADLVKGMKIAIPGAESGVAVTYRDLSALNPALKNTEAVYTEAPLAMKALAEKDQGMDALMLVYRPKERSPELQLAIDKPDTYQFVRFKKMEITAKLPDGQAIYSFVDVPLVRQGMKVVRSLPTVCTDGLLVASNTKIPAAQRQSLDRMVNEQWMRIYSKGFKAE